MPVVVPPHVMITASSRARRGALDVVAIVCGTTLVVAYFWLVHEYGLNTIWVDQWSDLSLIKTADSGHLTFSALWAQHTDNRIFFPNLVVLALAKTTHFNIVDEELLSAITLVAATATLIVGHRRHTPGTPWLLYIPVAIVMLSFVQSGDALWGYQFAWYLVMLALCCALVLCDNPKGSWFMIGGAILAGVVGSYSSLQGLLIWPAGLVVLLLGRRSLPFVLTWITTGALTTALFFVDYDSQIGGASDGYALHHPVEGLRFFLFSAGNVVDAHGGNGPVVLGALIVLAALWLTFLEVFRSHGDRYSSLGVGLICFGLLFTATITTGRAAAGLNAGGASRYTLFDMLTLVGCYLVILTRRKAAAGNRRSDRFDRAAWYGALGVVGVAVSLMLVVGTINGLQDARSWRQAQSNGSRVIASIDKAPGTMVERDLIVNPYFVPFTRDLAAFARQNRLTFFDNPTMVDRYTRAGLPYDARSLTTSIVVPRHGATVQGVGGLLASAQGDYGVRKVDFLITGPRGETLRVAGSETDLGWIARWDTTASPNGRYTIESFARDGANNQTESMAVIVHVANRHGPPAAPGA